MNIIVFDHVAIMLEKLLKYIIKLKEKRLFMNYINNLK